MLLIKELIKLLKKDKVKEKERTEVATEAWDRYTSRNISEMVNMLTASRSYEANVSAVKAIKGMAQSALEIGD